MPQQNLETKVKQTLKRIKINKHTENKKFFVPQTLGKQKVRGEKILVALSGGKDSSVTAYLLKKSGYNIEGFHIDLEIGSYSKECLKKVIELCKMLDIKLKVYDIKKEMGGGMCYLRTAIQSSYKAGENGQLKNCAICGVIKKWIMNKEARGLKAKYIATGHNLDDEAQTFLMNILKGSPQLSANSGVITKNPVDKKRKFIPRIKPLFYIAEDKVREFAVKNKIPFNPEKCPCALDSYRIQVRKFLNALSTKEKKNIIKNIEKISKRIEKLKDNKILYCEICGEPARNKVCKKCELMRIE